MEGLAVVTLAFPCDRVTLTQCALIEYLFAPDTGGTFGARGKALVSLSWCVGLWSGGHGRGADAMTKVLGEDRGGLRGRRGRRDGRVPAEGRGGSAQDARASVGRAGEPARARLSLTAPEGAQSLRVGLLRGKDLVPELAVAGGDTVPDRGPSEPATVPAPEEACVSVLSRGSQPAHRPQWTVLQGLPGLQGALAPFKVNSWTEQMEADGGDGLLGAPGSAPSPPCSVETPTHTEDADTLATHPVAPGSRVTTTGAHRPGPALWAVAPCGGQGLTLRGGL